MLGSEIFSIRGGLVKLYAKFETSWMFPFDIFSCGSCSSSCPSLSFCSSCDRGKTKSTLGPQTEVWTLD